MSQMGEFYEIKKQLVNLINHGTEEEQKLFYGRIHNFIVDQQKTLSETKRQTRFKLTMELGLENMELHEQIKELETDRNKYKQAYDGLVKSL